MDLQVLRSVRDRLQQGSPYGRYMIQDVLGALGFPTQMPRGRWRPEMDRGAWYAMPALDQEFEAVMRLANLIFSRNVPYAVDASAPEHGIDVELFVDGGRYRGTANTLCWAAAVALLNAIIQREEVARAQPRLA